MGTVKDVFFELLEIELATADGIFTALKQLIDNNKIPYKNIIGFAADNASTMMGHLNGVQRKFRDLVPDLYVQGCSCHSLHLCASAAAKKLPSNVEQFVRDIYAYFAHSSKRCDELKECQIFVKEKPHKILYPSQTRWLSLKAVVDRILLHWNSLTLFFQRAALEDNLPSAKAILNALKSSVYKAYLFYLSYVLGLITKLNLEFQSESSKVPLVLQRLSTIYKILFKNFIRKDIIDNILFFDINVASLNNHLPLDTIYFGAKVDALVQDCSETMEKNELHNFKLRALEFYIEICLQIKKRFNFNDSCLKFASNFTPEVALSGSIISIANFINLFPNVTIDIEAANTEWQLLGEGKFNNGFNENIDLNIFWKAVANAKNCLGKCMFSNLMIIVKIILALPHSSAAAERVFSDLSLLKTKTRNRLYISTCSAILRVKDKLQDDRCLHWEPPKSMMNYNLRSLETINMETDECSYS